MSKLFGIISILFFVFAPIVHVVLGDEADRGIGDWLQITLFYVFIAAAAIHIIRGKGEKKSDDRE